MAVQELADSGEDPEMATLASSLPLPAEPASSLYLVVALSI